jgi:hypothetical protein
LYEAVVAGTSYVIVLQVWEKPAAVVVTDVVRGARRT